MRPFVAGCSFRRQMREYDLQKYQRSPLGLMVALRALSSLLLLFPVFVSGQQADSLCRQQKLVLANLRKLHCSPPVEDSIYHRQVLELFIAKADERNILILQADRTALLQIILSGG